MKSFKIYGEAYPLEATTNVAPDAFGYKGDLVDDKPKGKRIGYVKMRDGSVIECYKKFNIAGVLIPIIILALVGIGLFVYLYFGQPKDISISGLPIKIGEDNNIVQYNGFMAVTDNSVDINFQNGSYPCTIQLFGEGIECNSISVGADEFVTSIPVTFTTTDGVVNATLTIITDTSTTSNSVVIEIPDNNTDDSAEGLDGAWEGEYIYGVQ